MKAGTNEMTDQLIRDPSTGETALLRRSIDDLDLSSLPAIVDDETLATVKAIARSPLPPLPPCDETTMGQALRMMFAALPRRQADDVTGELFVAAYERQLARYPAAAITWLCDEAIARCRWFPTVAECHELLERWRRDDYHTRRRAEANRIAALNRLPLQLPPPEPAPPLTADSIAAMPEPLVNVGLARGWLKRTKTGEIIEA